MKSRVPGLASAERSPAKVQESASADRPPASHGVSGQTRLPAGTGLLPEPSPGHGSCQHRGSVSSPLLKEILAAKRNSKVLQREPRQGAARRGRLECLTQRISHGGKIPGSVLGMGTLVDSEKFRVKTAALIS